MLTYEKKPKANFAEIVVDGKITDEEMNSAITQMKADLEKGGKLKLLEDVRTFEGMEPAAFFKDPRFGISMMTGVSHVALVTDAQGQLVTQAADARKAGDITLRFADGDVGAQVEGAAPRKTPAPKPAAPGKQGSLL